MFAINETEIGRFAYSYWLKGPSALREFEY